MLIIYFFSKEKHKETFSYIYDNDFIFFSIFKNIIFLKGFLLEKKSCFQFSYLIFA